MFGGIYRTLFRLLHPVSPQALRGYIGFVSSLVYGSGASVSVSVSEKDNANNDNNENDSSKNSVDQKEKLADTVDETKTTKTEEETNTSAGSAGSAGTSSSTGSSSSSSSSSDSGGVTEQHHQLQKFSQEDWDDHIVPYLDPQVYSVRASSLKEVGFVIDHNAILWCRQLIHSVSDSI